MDTQCMAVDEETGGRCKRWKVSVTFIEGEVVPVCGRHEALQNDSGGSVRRFGKRQIEMVITDHV